MKDRDQVITMLVGVDSTQDRDLYMKVYGITIDEIKARENEIIEGTHDGTFSFKSDIPAAVERGDIDCPHEAAIAEINAGWGDRLGMALAGMAVLIVGTVSAYYIGWDGLMAGLKGFFPS